MVEDEAMRIETGVKKALGIFLGQLSEEGVDRDHIKVQVEYNDGFNFIEFKEKEGKGFPQRYDKYYYPVFDDTDGYSLYTWEDDRVDYSIKKAVGVYKTKEEAIVKARELGWI